MRFFRMARPRRVADAIDEDGHESSCGGGQTDWPLSRAC
jgi:hypothetical protein